MMHTQTTLDWSVASLVIFLSAVVMPSIRVSHPINAASLSLVFAALSIIGLPIFLRYTDIPKNAVSLTLANLLIVGALVICTSLLMPGFYLASLMGAFRFVFIISVALTYLTLYPIPLHWPRLVAHLSWLKTSSFRLRRRANVRRVRV